MLDKVPIDPQQAIKRESPFTDETDLILSLFEARSNILVTIFCHESGIFFMILSLSGSKRKQMFTFLFCKGYDAENVVLPTLCPQPVRGSVCLYGWVHFCSHCKCVLPSDAYLNAFQIIIQRRKTANIQSVE